jgi:predicted hotdog family 3-hydroxylacyl-ACP dehydratase
MTTIPPIEQLVPHDGAMILVDRALSVDQESLVAEVTITAASMFCDGAGVGAWVGIEYMAQAIAAQAGHAALLRGEPVLIGYLLGTRRYHSSVPLFALGSVLHIHVHRALMGENGLSAFDCQIRDGASGASLATGTITVYQPDSVVEVKQRSIE